LKANFETSRISHYSRGSRVETKMLSSYGSAGLNLYSPTLASSQSSMARKDGAGGSSPRGIACGTWEEEEEEEGCVRHEGERVAEKTAMRAAGFRHSRVRVGEMQMCWSRGSGCVLVRWSHFWEEGQRRGCDVPCRRGWPCARAPSQRARRRRRGARGRPCSGEFGRRAPPPRLSLSWKTSCVRVCCV
jgi:hypothetical protein